MDICGNISQYMNERHSNFRETYNAPNCRSLWKIQCQFPSYVEMWFEVIELDVHNHFVWVYVSVQDDVSIHIQIYTNCIH